MDENFVLVKVRRVCLASLLLLSENTSLFFQNVSVFVGELLHYAKSVGAPIFQGHMQGGKAKVLLVWHSSS